MSERDTTKQIELAARTVLSAFPIVGGPAEVIFTALRERKEPAAEALLERVIADPVLKALFGNAVDAAARTGLDAKRRLLARAASAAVVDDALIDKSYLIVEALTHLDVPHIRALRRMSDEWDEDLVHPDPANKPNWGTSTSFAAEPEPIRAALVRTGTAKPQTNIRIVQHEPHRTDGITDFGIELLRRLRNEGLDDQC